jgi:hypothetical protein
MQNLKTSKRFFIILFSCLIILSCSTNKEDEGVKSKSNENVDSNEASTSITKTNSESKDWDKMLDDYEDYVDEYIKFYKKAIKGDQSAMSEYPALIEKATKLQTSMENAQKDNELSSNQIQRMMKIQTKMTNAAMEMQ